MTAATAPFPLNTADRLSLALCFAVIAHLVFILGVNFQFEDKKILRPEPLEILLVEDASAKAPDRPDYLAQWNLDGGGEDNERQRVLDRQIAAQVPDEETFQAEPPAFEPVPPDSEMQDAAQADAPDAPDPLAVAEAEREAAADRPPSQADASPEPGDRPPQELETPPVADGASLFASSRELIALHRELKRKLERKERRPKRKFISASTREYKYAAYMEAWRAKVERLGNLNYPEDVWRRRLSGSLILDVALRKDGSLEAIAVKRSSGHRLLDDAAIRIVQLAEPFAPFPEDILREVDVLHITRTWQFLHHREFR